MPPSLRAMPTLSAKAKAPKRSSVANDRAGANDKKKRARKAPSKIGPREKIAKKPPKVRNAESLVSYLHHEEKAQSKGVLRRKPIQKKSDMKKPAKIEEPQKEQKQRRAPGGSKPRTFEHEFPPDILIPKPDPASTYIPPMPTFLPTHVFPSEYMLDRPHIHKAFISDLRDVQDSRITREQLEEWAITDARDWDDIRANVIKGLGWSSQDIWYRHKFPSQLDNVIPYESSLRRIEARGDSSLFCGFAENAEEMHDISANDGEGLRAHKKDVQLAKSPDSAIESNAATAWVDDYLAASSDEEDIDSGFEVTNVEGPGFASLEDAFIDDFSFATPDRMFDIPRRDPPQSTKSEGHRIVTLVHRGKAS